MSNTFGARFEKAIRLLSEKLPLSENLIKPTLFHSIRVGLLLYELGYSENIVLAGLLHDIIEDSDINELEINELFNKEVATIVKANSKNDSILDTKERAEELIRRCILAGENALIVKAADIIDNYHYYAKTNNKKGIKYCLNNSQLLINNIPDRFKDPIFEKLKVIYKRTKI